MINYSSVGIIILTFNSEKIIERCLNSVLKISYLNVVTCVVDNASNDSTVSIILEKFPRVQLICADRNGGYTGGNNLGIEALLLSGCDYILILNPDTVLHYSGFVAEMVDQLEEDLTVGIAGPRVFYRTAEVIQNTVLFPPALWKNIVHWFRCRWDASFAQLSDNQVIPAQMLNGVCVMLRVKCLRQIGAFDESLFMYIEDAELAYRARLTGWKIKYYPIDSVIHEQKTEGYDETGFVAALLKRNSAYYLVKIGKYLDAIGYSSFSLGLLFIKLFFSLGSSSKQKRLSFLLSVLRYFYQSLTLKALGRQYVH